MSNLCSVSVLLVRSLLDLQARVSAGEPLFPVGKQHGSP